MSIAFIRQTSLNLELSQLEL